MSAKSHLAVLGQFSLLWAALICISLVLTEKSAAQSFTFGTGGFSSGGGGHNGESHGHRRPRFQGGITIRIPSGRPPPEIDERRCPRTFVRTRRGRCVCPRGTKRRGRRCRPIVVEVPACGPNEFFSKRRQRCFCRKGFRKIRGVCQPPQRVVQECGPNEFFSKRRQRCFCRKGHKRINGVCQRPERVVQQCDANEFFSKRRKRCFCRKGFKRINGDCVRPEQPPREVVETPRVPVPLPTPKPDPVKVAQSTQQCLPPDLYAMLTDAYGKPPAVSPCEAACLPKPATYTTAQLDNMSLKFGVNWCESCVKLGGYLPLASIQKIEKLAGITLCMTDGARMCSAPDYARVEPGVTRTRIREVIKRYPVTLGKQGDIAIVIGNEAYSNGLLNNANAGNDADAVMTLLTEQLGYKPNNILDLRNATLAQFHLLFGGPDGTPGELHKFYGNRKDGNVLIYMSTHGMTDAATGKSYIMPVDATSTNIAGSGYSLDDLYKSIARVGARTTMLAMEATFSTTIASQFVDPPNLPESDVSVLPDTPVPGLAVFTASDRDQRTLDDPEFGIGLFTRYLIEGMAGKADANPLGNGDSRIDTVELHVYTAHMVRQAARKSFGLEQKPILSKIDNLLIGRLAQR